MLYEVITVDNVVAQRLTRPTYPTLGHKTRNHLPSPTLNRPRAVTANAAPAVAAQLAASLLVTNCLANTLQELFLTHDLRRYAGNLKYVFSFV